MAFIRNHLYIPEALISEILLRLPVKSLLKFKSVCKEWNIRISSQRFMKLKSGHEGSQTYLLVFWTGFDLINNRFRSVSPFSDKALEGYEAPVNIDISKLLVTLFGPCNGIFCVIQGWDKLALWNPSTRKSNQLPCPPPSVNCLKGAVGFGFDPLTDDFKIVVIDNLPHFALYTSNDNSWRVLKEGSILGSGEFLGRSIFSKGFSFWKYNNQKLRMFQIIAFDMHNEVFKEIDMPGNLKPRYIKLALYDGYLAIFSENDKYDDRYTDIWLMKENECWVKLETLFLPLPVHWSIAGFRNGKIFFVTSYQNADELLVYDPISCSKRITKILNREVGGYMQLCFFNYRETFLLS